MKLLLAIAVALLVPLPLHNGDLNSDGRITTTDLVLLRRSIGTLNMRGDINYDGVVDEDDLHAMRVKLSERN